MASRGLMEQIDSSSVRHYEEFSAESLEAILQDLVPDYSRSSLREFNLLTGTRGVEAFDTIFTIASDEAVLQGIAPNYKGLDNRCDTLTLPIEDIHEFLKDIESGI